ncbi:MAG: hypothetical protein Q9177_005419 [Variospora cf. flavescens]
MMASMGQDDPFLEAQSDLLATLNATRSLFSSYLRIRSLAASASSPELAQARNELEANLHDLSSDLQDLIDSVKAVEGDPFRYGIDIDEVGRRRKLVEEVGGEVEDMREEVNNIANSQKRTGANGSALPPPSAFDPDIPDGDDYEAFEQQRQIEIMQEQDEALDGVFKTVGNLRQQADDMGRELEEQQEMLEEVDTLAERVGGKLQTGIKKVGWVIKKNEVVFPGPLTTKLDALFTVYGPGTQCWKSGGWFCSQSLHVKARGGEAPASVSAEDKECSPQFSSYATEAGN